MIVLATVPILISSVHAALLNAHYQIIAVDVLLAIFMILGYNWARWVTLVRCGFGFISGLSAAFALPGGHVNSIVFVFLVMIILAQIAFSLFWGLCLLFSKRVNEHFNT